MSQQDESWIMRHLPGHLEGCTNVGMLETHLKKAILEREKLSEEVRLLRLENNRILTKLKVSHRQAIVVEPPKYERETHSTAATSVSNFSQLSEGKMIEATKASGTLEKRGGGQVELKSPLFFLTKDHYLSQTKESEEFARLLDVTTREFRMSSFRTETDFCNRLFLDALIVEQKGTKFEISLQHSPGRFVRSKSALLDFTLPALAEQSSELLPYDLAEIRRVCSGQSTEFGWSSFFSDEFRADHLEFNDLIAEINPRNKIFCYWLKTPKAAISEFLESGIRIERSSRFFVFLSEFCLTSLHCQALQTLWTEIFQASEQVLSTINFSNLKNSIDRDLQGVSFKMLRVFFEKNSNVLIPREFDHTFRVQTLSTYIEVRTPSLKHAYLAEIDRIVPAIPLPPLEEILLLFFSILEQKKVLFASENPLSLSFYIAYFRLMMTPFAWPFPEVTLLSTTKVDLFKVNLPIMMGVLMPNNQSEKRKLLSKFSESAVVFSIDERRVLMPGNWTSSDALPDFNDFLSLALKLHRQIFESKPSYDFRFETTKTKEGFINKIIRNNSFFSSIGFKSKSPSQISDRWVSERNFLEFFRFFLLNFISTKLGEEIKLCGEQSPFADLTGFKGSISDLKFLEWFLGTQIFSEYVLRNSFGWRVAQLPGLELFLDKELSTPLP